MKIQIFNFRRDGRALVFFGVFYILFGIWAAVFQESIIYQPSAQDFQTCAEFSQAEKVNFQGTRIYFKNNSPRAVVFYHGNAGSACDRAFIADFFEDQGFSYVFPEYAGYSNGSAKPSHELLKQDVHNVIDFLQGRHYSQIIVAGESIGTGLASYHVSLLQQDKVLLISPFSSLLDIAKSKFWFYPVSLMVNDAFINSELLKNFNGGVLILHGDQDDIIPLKLGQKLFDTTISQHKKMVIVHGAGHNDIFQFPETYIEISRFLGL